MKELDVIPSRSNNHIQTFSFETQGIFGSCYFFFVIIELSVFVWLDIFLLSVSLADWFESACLSFF